MRRWSLVLLMGWGLACKQDEPGPPAADPVPLDGAADAMFEAACELAATCECEDGCDPASASIFVMRARDAGLQYDAQCMGELVRRVRDAECTLSDEPTYAECLELCRPFFGTLEEGDACDSLAPSPAGFPIALDACDADHACIFGTCQPRCGLAQGLPVGASCVPELCTEGAVCDVELRECVEGPGVGQQCTGFRECGEGWCLVAELVCQPLAAQGEPCTGFNQCESGYCPNGTCQPPPNAGEPCYGPCKPGSSCEQGVCIPHICH